MYFHKNWFLNRWGVSPGKHPFTHSANIFIILVKTQHHLTTEQTMWINPQPSYISSYSQTHSWTIITPTPTEYPRVIAPQSTRGVTICQEKLWWRFPILNGIMRRSIGILKRHLWHNTKKQQSVTMETTFYFSLYFSHCFEWKGHFVLNITVLLHVAWPTSIHGPLSHWKNLCGPLRFGFEYPWSRGSYSQQNVNMQTAPKTKVKVKNCTLSSEWPSCLCIFSIQTSPGIHVPTQPKHIVRE